MDDHEHIRFDPTERGPNWNPVTGNRPLDDDVKPNFTGLLAMLGSEWKSSEDAAGDVRDEEFTVRKISATLPISEELAMEYGFIPDTRPTPPPPTWRQRVRAKVRHKINNLRWRVAAKIGGTSREDIEEISWLW